MRHKSKKYQENNLYIENLKLFIINDNIEVELHII
jgi:hypothetical protein